MVEKIITLLQFDHHYQQLDHHHQQALNQYCPNRRITTGCLWHACRAITIGVFLVVTGIILTIVGALVNIINAIIIVIGESYYCIIEIK